MPSTSPNPADSLPPRTLLLALAVALGFLGLYLSTLTSDHSHDSVFFAMSAEAAVGRGAPDLEMFFPSHVLHQPFAALVLAGLQGLGIRVGGLVVLQAISSLAGAALAGLLVFRVAAATGSRLLAAGVAAATGLAGGVWFYATDGECNLVALALALAAFGPALRALDGSGRASVEAAILLALTCGWHLTLGTLWIGLLAVALLEGRLVARRAIVMFLGATALLAVFYIPRLIYLLGEPGAFDPVALVAFTGDWIGGGYLLRQPFNPIAELAQMFHGFASVPAGAPWARLAAALGVVPGLALAAGAGALVAGRADRAVKVLFAWFAVTLALYSAWGDRDFEFTNFLLVPAALLGATAIGRLLGRRPRAVTAVGGVVLAAALAAGALNWSAFIGPRLDPAANPYLRVAEMAAANTRPADRVVLTGIERQRLKIYVLYFGQRAAVIPEFFFGPDISHDESMRRFEAAMKRACDGGGSLYALGELVETREIPSPDGFPFERVRAAVRSLGPVEVARIPEGSLHRLERCPP